jgi:hypothetical protein
MDNRRQRVQEHLGVAAGESEKASGNVSLALSDLRRFVPYAEPCKGIGIENRFEREICGELERHSTGQKKTVSSVQQNGGFDAFNYQPALTGEHGVALNALVLREVNSHVARHNETAAGQTLRLQQGEHLRERIHLLTRSQTWLQ